MPSNSNDQLPGPGLEPAIVLCEQEIERLKAQLEVIKAGEHPRRRAMISDHVSRIDERQDALEKLQASVTDGK